MLAAGALGLAVAAVLVLVTDPFSGGSPSHGVTDNEYPTSLQAVTRRTLSQQTQESATLGFAGSTTIRIPMGTSPSAATQAQQSVTASEGMLTSAESSLSAANTGLAQARATLSADEQQEAVDCGGDNAAETPSSSGAGGDGSGGCAGAAQTVSSDQQALTAAASRMAADEHQVSSAQASLASAQTALAAAQSHETIYGQYSTFTTVPSTGALIRRGARLYAIDGQPVLLLYGPVVATRAFEFGMSPGPDVAELNANLDALGYGSGLGGDAFMATTAAAIRALQSARGLSVTGELLLGSVVFESGAVRVTGVMANVADGSGVSPGPVLTVSSTKPQVAIQLDAALQDEVKVGDPVTITLPDDQTTPGRISYVSSLASNQGGSATILVDAVPTDPAATGGLDQAPVNVSITTATVANALVVPVDALLALAGGGYAVEAVGARGVRRLVPVTIGLFDDADGLVQVSGPGLAAGQQVVVPGV